MNEVTLNPYQTPAATLDRSDQQKVISSLGRFSAWAVFFLSTITMGFYSIYWMNSKSQITNKHHKIKLSNAWISMAFITAILSIFFSLVEQSETLQMASLINTIVYFICYLKVIFHLRHCLESILSKRCKHRFILNAPLTFLFSVIYLQYKINQRIDGSASTPVSI